MTRRCISTTLSDQIGSRVQQPDGRVVGPRTGPGGRGRWPQAAGSHRQDRYLHRHGSATLARAMPTSWNTKATRALLAPARDRPLRPYGGLGHAQQRSSTGRTSPRSRMTTSSRRRPACKLRREGGARRRPPQRRCAIERPKHEPPAP